MGFAGFSIFFFLTGIISLQLIEKAQLRLDAFSFLYFLYNFAVRLTISTALRACMPWSHLPARKWRLSAAQSPGQSCSHVQCAYSRSQQVTVGSRWCDMMA